MNQKNCTSKVEQLGFFNTLEQKEVIYHKSAHDFQTTKLEPFLACL